MNILFENLNLLAIFVASITSFVIGSLWFGPKTFYPVWIKAQGREVPTERVQMSGGETFLMFGGTYLAGLIQAASIAVVIGLGRAAGVSIDAASGALFAFIFSVGLGAFGSLSHRMFGQADHKIYRSLKVWILEVGQDVVALTVAGAIIGAWH